eukprot:Pgem_evm1s12162
MFFFLVLFCIILIKQALAHEVQVKINYNDATSHYSTLVVEGDHELIFDFSNEQYNCTDEKITFVTNPPLQTYSLEAYGALGVFPQCQNKVVLITKFSISDNSVNYNLQLQSLKGKNVRFHIFHSNMGGFMKGAQSYWTSKQNEEEKTDRTAEFHDFITMTKTKNADKQRRNSNTRERRGWGDIGKWLNNAENTVKDAYDNTKDVVKKVSNRIEDAANHVKQWGEHTIHDLENGVKTFKKKAEQELKEEGDAALKAIRTEGQRVADAGDWFFNKTKDFFHEAGKDIAAAKHWIQEQSINSKQNFRINADYNESLTIVDGKFECGHGQERSAFVAAKAVVKPVVDINIQFGYYLHVPFSTWDYEMKTFFEHNGAVSTELDLVLKAGLGTEKEFPIFDIPIPTCSFVIPGFFEIGPTLSLDVKLGANAQIEVETELKTGFSYGTTSNSFDKLGHSSGPSTKNVATTPHESELKNTFILEGELEIDLVLKLQVGISMEIFNEKLFDVQAGFSVKGGVKLKSEATEKSISSDTDVLEQRDSENAELKVGVYVHGQVDLFFHFYSDALSFRNFWTLYSHDWLIKSFLEADLKTRRRRSFMKGALARVRRYDKSDTTGNLLTSLVLKRLGLTCKDMVGK